MPYIKQERREAIELAPEGLIAPNEIKTVGELNYAITRLLTAYILNNGGMSYTNGANARAACHDAAAEFYRRVMEDYENEKWMENGDVYGPLIRGGIHE